MTDVKIFAIYSQFFGEFTPNFKDSYSQAYSPICVRAALGSFSWQTGLLC